MALYGYKRRLRWSDFKEVDASPDGDHDAQTGTRILFSAPWTADSAGNWQVTEKKVRVTLTLNQDTTWVVKGKKDAKLLAHEQAHYDIAAVAARSLEAKLRKLKGQVPRGSSDAMKEKIDGVIDQTIEEIIGKQSADGRIEVEGLLQKVQSRYDEDLTCGSNHGLEKDHQAQWELRIHKAFAAKRASLNELDSCPRPAAKGAAAD